MPCLRCAIVEARVNVVFIRRYGSNEVVEFGELPRPAPKPGQALTEICHIEAGSRVTIVGASGGVGSYAVQIAKALGAEVAGVSSGSNAELVRSLGAETTVDYRQIRFNDVLTEQDIVFDTLGRETLARCARGRVRCGQRRPDPRTDGLSRSMSAWTCARLRSYTISRPITDPA